MFCLLMEHTHSKFRSSKRHPALLLACAEIRQTHTHLDDDLVKKKLNDLEATSKELSMLQHRLAVGAVPSS